MGLFPWCVVPWGECSRGWGGVEWVERCGWMGPQRIVLKVFTRICARERHAFVRVGERKIICSDGFEDLDGLH